MIPNAWKTRITRQTTCSTMIAAVIVFSMVTIFVAIDSELD